MRTLTHSKLEGVHDGIDFDARYAIKGHKGIAWFIWGFKTEHVAGICYGEDDDGNEIEIECWDDPEEIEDREQIVATMVGDDRKWLFSREDLILLDELAYCHVCGQIGCSHDGLDRSEQ